MTVSIEAERNHVDERGQPRASQPYEPLIERLRTRVLDGPGRLDVQVRRAAFEGDAVPDELTGYVETVRRHAYKLTDGDVDAVLARGWSEDQVFELTVATAVGIGLAQLEAVRRAMDSTT